ncbi:MAG: 1-phosphofructokinase [Treponema sp.]|nr:1-phosphofructokinase [Treponema sp.]
MIYTLTVNPSLDYMIQVPQFTTGIVNRSSSEKVIAGGKGINVSLMLKNLGVESCALGFVAGFTGMEIERQLQEKNVRTDFVHLKNGLSRINVKIKSGQESEINASGPVIQKDEIDEMFNKLNELKENDIIVLAGSIPRTLPDDFYAQIMQKLVIKKIRFVVDAEKRILMEALTFKPLLVKPNNFELGQIFDVELNTRDDVVPYAKKIHELGATNVLVSLAGEGAVLVDEKENVFTSAAPKGNVINSVGAGDSMVAGFISEYIATADTEKSFYKGISAGSASAFCEGFASDEMVNELFNFLCK